jgi:hypothetical protein
MTDERDNLLEWNEARISCQFSSKCPKTGDRLVSTGLVSVRHCPECDRDVHLVLTEDNFRRHAEAGHCVAVKVLRPEDSNEWHIVGSTAGPFDTGLARL